MLKPKELMYVVFSFLLWLIVEYITVWHSRFGEWMSYMPWALFQYLFIILVFWLFLFVFKWKHRGIFVVMIMMMYVFEFLWQNFLLLDIAWFIPTSVLLIQMWGFLTFVPYWILKKEMGKHKKVVIFYCLWPVLGFVMATLM
ncbi:MAG: hypothetical protein KKD18_06695 [Nanoarchaeota archaeon]|nr:hypothetical protein [Nanoarchaeota archaeon]MBU0978080.1 hypothetical protein [Nanoarchaeota archaeon]